MNKRRFLSITAISGFAALAGCGRKGGSAADSNVAYYTCTMHPSVRSQNPKGKCPICSMDLVAVYKKGRADTAAPQGTPGPVTNEFSVPVERQQQIGVTYATAERRSLSRTIRSVGMVVPDKTRQWEFVARVEGYVEKLHVASPGEWVEAGQPLLTTYSPELSTAERELVNLLAARDRATTADARANNDRLIEASRRRLEQWSITAGQIAELEKSREPSEFLTLRSPFKGVVEEVPVRQGRKIAVGDPLVNVADLSTVWVWAEFYENELPLLGRDQKVRVTTAAWPGEVFEARLGLIDPFLAESTRTAKARIDLPNPDFKFRPGMYVNVELTVELGEALAIPVGAVLPTGLHGLTFVDKGGGKLEPRMLKLGRKCGDFYEVLGGLDAGERVVASANFLIDAEAKVQGALKSFEEPAAGKAKP